MSHKKGGAQHKPNGNRHGKPNHKFDHVQFEGEFKEESKTGNYSHGFIALAESLNEREIALLSEATQVWVRKIKEPVEEPTN